MAKYVIGLDYGSDSARALIVNAESGEILATSVKYYPRWQKGLYCNPKTNQWRQHPKDYLEVLESSVKEALSKCPSQVAKEVVGIAFDTTGSTPALTDKNGTPLALLPEFSEDPNAMFILWKDHTAVKEAKEINEKTARYPVNYLKYVGGIYSAEWFWAKAMHILREDKAVAEKACSIVEYCEWLPAVLTGTTALDQLTRSRCAEGHKAMWNAEWGGLPPVDYFEFLEPKLKTIREHISNKNKTAAEPVGHLCKEWADKLGLSENVVVAGGAYDCHMGAVGAGVTPHTLVRVIGTSTCDVMVSSYQEIGKNCIKGICGQVDGSVIPGMVGLEAGQSSFGDVYAMFRHILEYPIRNFFADKFSEEELDKICDKIIPQLTKDAEKIPIQESVMLATDWVNGRRTPDANQFLKATISGFTLGTTAPQIFRSLVEATAYGTKAIVDRFEEEGVPINNVIGIGGIALKSPFVMQTMCDVINKPIKVCNTDQACALGAAMFAATAAGVYRKVEDASAAMNSGFSKEYEPNPENTRLYAPLYQKYLKLAQFTEKEFYHD
ncbi:ribulokinase [Prevotella cerevisiae]|uniref:Ribulokinase n=1 Tax=Segatella cerevisiae TaxID=2053716 RepID=A0ABT1BUF1_9BACT|nr:ribulokinase [Segatella cerevisiae]MCO6024706.1 ribulokinase [Segatella cerevisiae]